MIQIKNENYDTPPDENPLNVDHDGNTSVEIRPHKVNLQEQCVTDAAFPLHLRTIAAVALVPC